MVKRVGLQVWNWRKANKFLRKKIIKFHNYTLVKVPTKSSKGMTSVRHRNQAKKIESTCTKKKSKTEIIQEMPATNRCKIFCLLICY